MKLKKGEDRILITKPIDAIRRVIVSHNEGFINKVLLYEDLRNFFMSDHGKAKGCPASYYTDLTNIYFDTIADKDYTISVIAAQYIKL